MITATVKYILRLTKNSAEVHISPIEVNGEQVTSIKCRNYSMLNPGDTVEIKIYGRQLKIKAIVDQKTAVTS